VIFIINISMYVYVGFVIPSDPNSLLNEMVDGTGCAVACRQVVTCIRVFSSTHVYAM
jgi:hypothetical protein